MALGASSSAPSTRTFTMFASLCIFPPLGRLSGFVRSVRPPHYKRAGVVRVEAADSQTGPGGAGGTDEGLAGAGPFPGTKRTYDRSEERRVGKERKHGKWTRERWQSERE